jgi:hypothetical protein
LSSPSHAARSSRVANLSMAGLANGPRRGAAACAVQPIGADALSGDGRPRLPGFGDNAPARVAQNFRQVLEIPSDDGVIFKPSGTPRPYFRGARMFGDHHDDPSAAGEIKGFVMPYLGQVDERLPVRPSDLVPRQAVVDYPTDFNRCRRRISKNSARAASNPPTRCSMPMRPICNALRHGYSATASMISLGLR